MTIKQERSKKKTYSFSTSVVNFIDKKFPIFLIGSMVTLSLTFYFVNTYFSDKKIETIISTHPILQIIRNGMPSNLLTKQYKVVKIDGAYNISVTYKDNSSVSYPLDRCHIYEVVVKR